MIMLNLLCSKAPPVDAGRRANLSDAHAVPHGPGGECNGLNQPLGTGDVFMCGFDR